MTDNKAAGKKANKKDTKKEEDLSIEDKQLKEKIEFYVTKLSDPEPRESQSGLVELTNIVKNATKTMTSVPKPFKFLKAHYKSIVTLYESLAASDFKKNLANFLSVLSMIFADKSSRASLSYLLQGTAEDYKSWGHEYLSHLSSDIGKEYDLRIANGETTEDLVRLVDEIVPYFIENNAEHDAIDLLLIVDKLQDIKGYVSKTNFAKVNMYLSACSNYSVDADEMTNTLTILYDIALSQEEFTVALRAAIRLDDAEKIKRLFDECPDEVIKKQLAFNSARQKIYIPDLTEEENKIISNSMLSEFYIKLAKDLEVEVPKKPEQIYKAHLEENSKPGEMSTAMAGIYNTYVNSIVNAGLRADTLMMDDGTDKRKPWIMEVKEEGQIAAVASLGLINTWYPECVNDHIMPYLDNEGEYVRAGACMGIGLCNSGINDENDIAFVLLEEQFNKEDSPAIVKNLSTLGMGLAYAGRNREDIKDLFKDVVINTEIPIEQSAFAALSLGLVYVGKCDEDIANLILQTLLERTDEQLNNHWSKMFGIALGLLFMGQQSKSDALVSSLGVVEHPIRKFVEIMVESIAYIGSGNVLKVQKMCNQYTAGEKYSEVALVGLALIASSEEVGNEMATRLINHALHFSTPETKRMIPLALAVLNLSNPKIQVMDMLQKLAYDTDSELAGRAIFSLGLIGAGSNNSRLADIFRKLASYHNRDSSLLFCVRVSQGLLYAGKGMLTLNPYYSERFLLSKIGMAGIIIFLTSLFDLKQTLLGKHHYFIFFLSLSLYPKFLFLLNDKLEPMTLNVRVGQAVDVVGQAGKPKKITGFQTHSTPVIISHGERAELATEEFIPIQDQVLQNFVILRRNPDYVEEEKPRKKTSL